MMLIQIVYACFVFFFNDTATTEIYTLSLHDALPISSPMTCCSRDRIHRSAVDSSSWAGSSPATVAPFDRPNRVAFQDRKSTRLNSSHANISYAVFCLKKKKKTNNCLDQCDKYNATMA